MNETLLDIEKSASQQGFLLRIQVRRPLGLWSFKLVVAKQISPEKIVILGEIKGWAYKGIKGLQLDTMKVAKDAPVGVGQLIWAAIMAWAIENTPCKFARLLAIDDDDIQHKILVRYFLGKGFNLIKTIGTSIGDLPLRLVWGGSGVLMLGECKNVLTKNLHSWELILEKKLKI